MKVVVFDLDSTLAYCNVSFAFGKFLVKKKELSLLRACFLGSVYALHKLGFCSLSKLHNTAFRLLFYKKNSKKTEQLVHEFLKGDALFRPCILAELRAAIVRQENVWILSSSPDFLVGSIAKLLGVAHFAGSCYLKDEQGNYSHICSIMDGKTKEAVLDQFLQGQGWGCVTVYSDSILDLPLLERAAVPVAVFPDKALRKVAKSKSWQLWEGT